MLVGGIAPFNPRQGVVSRGRSAQSPVGLGAPGEGLRGGDVDHRAARQAAGRQRGDVATGKDADDLRVVVAGLVGELGVDVHHVVST